MEIFIYFLELGPVDPPPPAAKRGVGRSKTLMRLQHIAVPRNGTLNPPDGTRDSITHDRYLAMVPIALWSNAPAPSFGVVTGMTRGTEDAGVEQATVRSMPGMVEFEPFLLTALLAAVLGSD